MQGCDVCGWTRFIDDKNCPKCGHSLIPGKRDGYPKWHSYTEPISDQFWNELKAKTNLTKTSLRLVVRMFRDIEIFGIHPYNPLPPSRERWVYFCYDSFEPDVLDTFFTEELLQLQSRAEFALSTPERLHLFVHTNWSSNFIRFGFNSDRSERLYDWMNSEEFDRSEEYWKSERSKFKELGFGKYYQYFDAVAETKLIPRPNLRSV